MFLLCCIVENGNKTTNEHQETSGILSPTNRGQQAVEQASSEGDTKTRVAFFLVFGSRLATCSTCSLRERCLGNLDTQTATTFLDMMFVDGRVVKSPNGAIKNPAGYFSKTLEWWLNKGFQKQCWPVKEKYIPSDAFLLSIKGEYPPLPSFVRRFEFSPLASDALHKTSCVT